jgi:hypothetical protein
MSKQPQLHNWTKVADARGLYMRSRVAGESKGASPSQGEQEKTSVVLKSLEKRMGVILQGMAKR